ncbi:hypothetical protein VULLAG_LOCUS15099 [Vulpes lagopus]
MLGKQDSEIWTLPLPQWWKRSNSEVGAFLYLGPQTCSSALMPVPTQLSSPLPSNCPWPSVPSRLAEQPVNLPLELEPQNRVCEDIFIKLLSFYHPHRQQFTKSKCKFIP